MPKRPSLHFQGAFLRYLFDLTSSANWNGRPVGITRVEQELGRRARRHLGADLTFCVYDKYRNRVLALDDETARNAIDGKVRIKFQERVIDYVKSAAADQIDVLRRKLRRILLRNVTAYRGLQSMRGRSWSRAEVQKIQELEFTTHASRTPTPVRLVVKPIELDSDTILISGGHDWNDKDLRGIADLKQRYGFQYWAVIYDIIPLLFPKYLVPGYVELLAEYFQRLTALANHVMCISEATRRDWIGYCKAQGVHDMPCDVFPLGSDLSPEPAAGPAAELPPALSGKRYALIVSTIEPRKNHRLLYDVWNDCVRQQLVDTAHDRLVFIGRVGWAMDDFLRELPLNPLTRDSIIFLSDVDDAQLNLIYRNCAFVVFPSFYEGFGLPVVEALGHGKPCISSDAGALPEVGGELVLRLDPNDRSSWTRAIAHFLSAPDEVEAWSARVRQSYKPTTWDMAAKIFFDTIVKHAH